LKKVLKYMWVVAAIAVIILTLHITPVASASDKTQNIQAANAAINQAFANVQAAEKAGENVTELLIKLNTAAQLLAQAENSNNAGNSANVVTQAEGAQKIAIQVNNDAQSLSQAQNNLLFSIIFSISSSFIFIVIMLLIWRRTKKRMIEKTQT
jgi:hypothetical protein